MSITRWSRMLALATTVAAATVVLAAPPTPPGKSPAKPTTSAKVPTLTPIIPVVPDHPGVHINSVKIQGNCRTAATYLVEIQNNLTKTAQHGQVDLKAANNAMIHTRFDNLRAGEKRTLTIPTPWILTCTTNETGQPSCVEATILMEPDLTANGEVWDNIAHSVCVGGANGNVPQVVDRPHK